MMKYLTALPAAAHVTTDMLPHQHPHGIELLLAVPLVIAAFVVIARRNR